MKCVSMKQEISFIEYVRGKESGSEICPEYAISQKSTNIWLIK